jgi:aminomethyltransferase
MVRVGLLVEGRIPVREAGQIYAAENDPIGYVTSGSFSPVLKTPIAMAMIKREFARPGTALSAVVRDSRISLQVCRLPFVPHHYHN